MGVGNFRKMVLIIIHETLSPFPNMKYLAKGDGELNREVTIFEATLIIPIL